ncbi:MAG: Glutathione S-transferase domain protein, partial [Brevundimonas sp.]|nr:Glutathione S-transferase domain protein [Brevundimonas sp.]
MSARLLFHFPFDPGSRTARLALAEAKIAFEETIVRPWEADCPLGDLNPSAMPPVLQVSDTGRPLTLCEAPAILGWIEDQQKTPLLLSS